MMLTLARSHGMGRTMKFVIMSLLAAALLIVGPAFSHTGAAQAQEVRERRSIIDLIFRNKPRKRVVRPESSVIREKKPRRKKRTPRSDPAVTEAEIDVAKKPDAKKVLVIGDFMGSALADGLEVAFENDPGIVIEKRTSGSSGLVRTDYLDWPATLTAHIGELKPALIVIMLGANDRQQISMPGRKEKFQTEGWKAEYERRIASIIEIARQNKTPFLWVGLPSFSSPSLSADAATLNSMYRAKAEMASGEFIDIWDGFADENGKFIASGSDINGQPVRLRGSDGLSLTKAGKRKMAFYVEKSIRKLIGVGGVPAISQLNPAGKIDATATRPEIADIVSVPPISLLDPELDGGAQLLDTAAMPKASGLSPRDKLIQKGQTVDAPEGRVDDFSWKPPAKPAG